MSVHRLIRNVLTLSARSGLYAEIETAREVMASRIGILIRPNRVIEANWALAEDGGELDEEKPGRRGKLRLGAS